MTNFQELLTAEMDRLGLDDKAAAKILDVSVPTIERWREGVTVPAEWMREYVIRMLLALRYTEK